MKIEANNKFFPTPGSLWDRIIDNAIARIRSLDKTKCWHIEIRKYVKERTEKQRGALFGPAYKVLMDYMGLRGSKDKDYLHSYICSLYYGCHPNIPNKPIRTTTTDEDGNRVEMTTEEAIDFSLSPLMFDGDHKPPKVTKMTDVYLNREFFRERFSQLAARWNVEVPAHWLDGGAT